MICLSLDLVLVCICIERRRDQSESHNNIVRMDTSSPKMQHFAPKLKKYKASSSNLLESKFINPTEISKDFIIEQPNYKPRSVSNRYLSNTSAKSTLAPGNTPYSKCFFFPFFFFLNSNQKNTFF